MQEQLLQNLDKLLNNILQELEMSLYTHNFDYYLLDNSKMKSSTESNTYKNKKFIKSENFFKQLNIHYQPNVKIEKESRNIFLALMRVSNEEEKQYLINHYQYFLTYDQTLNYLDKIEKNKNKAILFVTQNLLKGKLREVDKEEKFLIKIKNLDNENYYGNLLSYLSNHSDIYTKSIYSNAYQGMLKNLINEHLPNQRKNFAIFTGDSKKKYLNNSSILHPEEDFETVIKLNRTVIEEKYVPENLKEKHEISNEQNTLITNIGNLLKQSSRLNLKNVYPVYTEDHEVMTFYITKNDTKIEQHEIINYVQACLKYWRDNIQELKLLDNKEMIKNISLKAEIIYLHNELNNKLINKGTKDKKAKL